MSVKKGYFFIILCVLSNFVSQIFFDLLSKNELNSFSPSFESINEFLIILITSRLFFTAIIFYAFSALFWLIGLKSISLSKAFSVLSTNYVFITLYSIYFLDEVFSSKKIISCISIIVGVLIMNMDFKSIKIKYFDSL